VYLSALRKKHPPSSSVLPNLPAPQSQQCLSVDECEVRKVVLSFLAGSAGGPDSLRPPHIRDLLMCRKAGPEFISALTAFVNLVLAGRCSLNVASVFFGGRLLALNKKFGRVRPIHLKTFGIQMRKFFGINKLMSYFYPHQLGVGTPGGCEAALYSARRYLETLPPLCWQNSILQTRLIIYTNGRCCFLCITKFPSSTRIVDQLTAKRLACSLAPTSFSPRRVPSKVIRLGHCYLA